MGFRARDVERDSTAASFKFNNVVGELRAKLDSGERLLRPVGAAKYGDDLEGAAVWNPVVGTSEDRQPDWDSSRSQRLKRAFDKRSLESRMRSFEDQDRTLMNRRGSDSK